jgi:hypothetical protein
MWVLAYGAHGRPPLHSTSEIFDAYLPLMLATERWGDAIFNYFTHRYTAGYTESLNGLMKLLARQGRGFSFEVIRAKALLTHGLRKCCRPAYGEEWYRADVSHDASSSGADSADLTACVIARPNGNGTPLPTALMAPDTVKLGNSKSSGNP